jgi:hypothetical protein
MYKYLGLLSCVALLFISGRSKAQQVKLGAYYYDGWTDSARISQTFRQNFPERESKWGWVTSSQKIVDEQINSASASGLSFFSFCWYYNGAVKYKTHPENNALRCYQKSAYNDKMEYCLLVANHAGYIIGPKDWDTVSQEWVNQFKSPHYLKTAGKPLLIFFSVSTLVTEFGTPALVHEAFDRLKALAEKNGLAGVSIAACTMPDKASIKTAEDCGFDILTGYNYHPVGFVKDLQETPLKNLQVEEKKVWDKFPFVSNLKYIPVVTLNWDPRPWANAENHYETKPYFTGFSPSSVKTSVKNGINWINAHPGSTPAEKLVLLYAWNESGEGAWLQPLKSGVDMAKGIKKLVSN